MYKGMLKELELPLPTCQCGEHCVNLPTVKALELEVQRLQLERDRASEFRPTHSEFPQ